MFKMIKPEITVSRCDGCGLCVEVCLKRCLAIIEARVVMVEGVECDWCTNCEAVCIKGAICCPYEIIIE